MLVRPMGWMFLFLVTSLSAEDWDLSFRTEAGTFNTAYHDRQYVTSADVSFGVPYVAIGLEGQRRDAEGNVLVLSTAQTTIGSGTKFNFDQWESRPLTLVNLAAVSMGRDWGWWEFTLGVGALVQVQDFSANGYLLPDGTLTAGKDSGLDWNRRESYTLVTGLLRVFPATEPHLALAVARGPLSLTENLFRLQGVWPLDHSRFDVEVGFSSPLGLIFSGEGVLRSNERLSVGWLFGDASARIGLRLGFLLRTIVAGSGEVDLWRRFSLGLEGSLGWPSPKP